VVVPSSSSVGFPFPQPTSGKRSLPAQLIWSVRAFSATLVA
jgi:hypothetical protein